MVRRSSRRRRTAVAASFRTPRASSAADSPSRPRHGPSPSRAGGRCRAGRSRVGRVPDRRSAPTERIDAAEAERRLWRSTDQRPTGSTTAPAGPTGSRGSAGSPGSTGFCAPPISFSIRTISPSSTCSACSGSKSSPSRLRTPSSLRRWCTAGVTPCRVRQLRAHCSTHPSTAMTGRSLRALRTRLGTSPPTPAMHDISAMPRRSSWTAIQLVI
ncbi:hypothetical protein BU52_23645 [Streptomyces toyocaensis]|uniref:Uncharacterized protein n=1 Tax=Streptomyces toyocaensis TaxID=55952 RepID=A0A081XMQ4_STRTO|nr:hypothetical protein BU52_23645 [Streptomyces toyocaensis]